MPWHDENRFLSYLAYDYYEYIKTNKTLRRILFIDNINKYSLVKWAYGDFEFCYILLKRDCINNNLHYIYLTIPPWTSCIILLQSTVVCYILLKRDSINNNLHYIPNITTLDILYYTALKYSGSESIFKKNNIFQNMQNPYIVLTTSFYSLTGSLNNNDKLHYCTNIYVGCTNIYVGCYIL